MLLLLLLSCDPEPSKESVDRDGDGVESPSDCDDGAAGVRPGAPEYCNGVDDNCDGAVDEQALDATLSYADRDGDGYGDPATGAPTCDLPAGFVVDATDCSDTDATISPVGTEVCGDTLDQDCSGADLACPAWTGSWGADELEALRIEGVTEGGHFGFGLEGGDFNGDGAGDLLVGDGEWAYESRRGLIIGYAGPFVAGSRTADQQAGLWIPNGHPDFEGSFGSHLEKVGDLNLDGSEDFMAVLDYGDYSSVFSGWGAYHYYDALDNRDCSSAAPLPHRGTAPAWACGRPNGGARGGSVTVHAMDNEHVVESYGATTTGDRAGTAVAGADLDGDGGSDLIISQPGQDLGGADAGALYIFYSAHAGSGTSDFSAADVVIYGDAEGDGLGSSLRAGADWNGDGAPDLLVGASAESSVAAGAGAVYLLAAPRTDSIGTIALGKITGDQAADFLGDRAVDSGDFDGDGRPDLALAAPYRSGRAEGAGAAWVFYGPGAGTRSVATAEVQLWGMNARDAFGTDLAVIPDSNGDGTDELAISAEEGDGLLADAGVVWIWLGG